MSYENLSDAELYFRLFDLPGEDGQYHVDSWPLYRCPEAIRLVKQRAAQYRTMPSVSGYIRAFNELCAENAIRPVRSSDPLKTEPVFTLTPDEYFRLPASEVVRRYRDVEHPEFRQAVDKLIAEGKI